MRQAEQWKEAEGPDGSERKPKICFFPRLLPSVSSLAFLRCHFLIRKMGMLIPAYRVVGGAGERGIRPVEERSVRTWLAPPRFPRFTEVSAGALLYPRCVRALVL